MRLSSLSSTRRTVLPVALMELLGAAGGGGGAGGVWTGMGGPPPPPQPPRRAGGGRALRVAQGESAEAEGGETDWRAVGLFGAGLAIGALLGAGTALLLAPASGFETRMRLARGARRARARAVDRWDIVGDRIRRSARRSRRKLE